MTNPQPDIPDLYQRLWLVARKARDALEIHNTVLAATVERLERDNAALAGKLAEVTAEAVAPKKEAKNG